MKKIVFLGKWPPRTDFHFYFLNCFITLNDLINIDYVLILVTKWFDKWKVSLNRRRRKQVQLSDDQAKNWSQKFPLLTVDKWDLHGKFTFLKKLSLQRIYVVGHCDDQLKSHRRKSTRWWWNDHLSKSKVSSLIVTISFVDRYSWILKSTKLSIFNQRDINKKNKRYVFRYGIGPRSEYHKKKATNGQQTKGLFVNQFFFATSNDKFWTYSNEIDLFLLELTFKALLHFQLIIQSKI